MIEIHASVAGYIFNDKDELLLIKHKELGLWLPVGGHVGENETPDNALEREAREEVGLSIKLLFKQMNYRTSRESQQLAMPIYVNTHHVTGHMHWCLFYVAKARNSTLKIDKMEIDEARWVNEQGADHLIHQRSPLSFDPENIHNLAFEKYKELKRYALG